MRGVQFKISCRKDNRYDLVEYTKRSFRIVETGSWEHICVKVEHLAKKHDLQVVYTGNINNPIYTMKE